MIDANQERNVSIRIVQNEPNDNFPDNDTAYLAQHGIAQVRSINWEQLVGAGILHTKLIIVDDASILSVATSSYPTICFDSFVDCLFVCLFVLFLDNKSTNPQIEIFIWVAQIQVHSYYIFVIT